MQSPACVSPGRWWNFFQELGAQWKEIWCLGVSWRRPLEPLQRGSDFLHHILFPHHDSTSSKAQRAMGTSSHWLRPLRISILPLKETKVTTPYEKRHRAGRMMTPFKGRWQIATWRIWRCLTWLRWDKWPRSTQSQHSTYTWGSGSTTEEAGKKIVRVRESGSLIWDFVS